MKECQKNHGWALIICPVLYVIGGIFVSYCAGYLGIGDYTFATESIKYLAVFILGIGCVLAGGILNLYYVLHQQLLHKD